MTDNMFDKFVRDKLKDHQSSVPPGLWEKIERKKDKDPKGGFFLPRIAIWAALFIVVASIGTGYYLSKNNNNTTESISQTTEQSAAANNGSTENENVNNTATNNNTNNNNSDNTVTSSATNATDNSKDALNDEPVSGAGKTATDVTTNKNADQKNTAASAGKTTAGKNSTNKSNYNSGSRHIPVQMNDGSNHISGVVPVKKINTSKAGNKQSKGAITLLPGEITTENKDAENTGINVNRISLTAGKTAYNFRNIPSFGQGKYNMSELKITGIDCPTTGKLKRDDWYLEVYGSPDVIMKSVKATGNAAFVAKKDSTESQQVSFTAGFRISKAISENMLLKTGLQYSQINERFDLRTENERKIITVVTIRTITGSNGADSTISDTSSVEQIGYRLQRTYNRYRSIDIPVLLSYEFGTNKLKFGLNAGAIINLYSWYNGNTIDDSLNVISMNSKATGTYKQNVGIGLYAGFSIIKPIATKFDIFVEPYMKYNLSNMARSSAYTQRFNTMGINFGIRYKLKGRQRSELN